MGIELLNEPLPERLAGGTGAVVKFSKDGYGKVREVGNTPVLASDAFQAGSFWNGVLEGDATNGKFTPPPLFSPSGYVYLKVGQTNFWKIET